MFFFLFSGQLNLKNEELTATEIKHRHEMEEIKAKYKTDKGKFQKEHFFCLSLNNIFLIYLNDKNDFRSI